jgi:hypothetical protein
MIKIYNNTFVSESGHLITGNSLNNNKIQGVYLLFDSEENLIYVGQSNNIYNRLISHSKNINKNWVFSYIIPIENKEHRLFTEAIMIKSLKPLNNIAKGYPKNYGWSIKDMSNLYWQLHNSIEQISFMYELYHNESLNLNEL